MREFVTTDAVRGTGKCTTTESVKQRHILESISEFTPTPLCKALSRRIVGYAYLHTANQMIENVVDGNSLQAHSGAV